MTEQKLTEQCKGKVVDKIIFHRGTIKDDLGETICDESDSSVSIFFEDGDILGVGSKYRKNDIVGVKCDLFIERRGEA
jgi:hypothetical protein